MVLLASNLDSLQTQLCATARGLEKSMVITRLRPCI